MLRQVGDALICVRYTPEHYMMCTMDYNLLAAFQGVNILQSCWDSCCDCNVFVEGTKPFLWQSSRLHPAAIFTHSRVRWFIRTLPALHGDSQLLFLDTYCVVTATLEE